MREYSPLFNMSDRMINLLTEISEEVGRVSVVLSGKMNPLLRKENIIKKVYASLAMEESDISFEQIRGFIYGENVIDNHKDMRVVKNLYEAYDMSFKLNPYSINDLFFAQKMILSGFTIESTEFREDKIENNGNGIFDSNIIPSRFIPGAVRDIFEWYKRDNLHPVIKCAIVYHEFELLQPFAAGNGPLSRLWLDLLLCKWKDIFFCMSVESELYNRIQEYKELTYSIGRPGESNKFIEFILETILFTLKKAQIEEKIPVWGMESDASFTNGDSIKRENSLGSGMTGNAKMTVGKEVSGGIDVSGDSKNTAVSTNNKTSENTFAKRLVNVLGNEVLTTNEIMLRLGMTHKPTFRKNYLNPAIEMGLVEMTVPGKPRSRYQKYRKIS
ncbi:Fic/DOC family protein [Lachnoanaerobaculum sp. ICM7]|uniref:Fic family protein n=1 Tax=Lachnoanaerobaculum sp. ICM7 TaxID=936594 RepID=UPI00027A610D|nr:Fic family protein [Lachnoanaerobaculum sp. ICM7]EJP23796.1 Fic/DOC family protein [Lachnoanaerobaculum sp. ICM7]